MSVRDARNPFLGSRAARVAFTVGAEAADVIKVTASVKRGLKADAAPARRQHAFVYLTQSLTTLAVAGTAPSGTVAVAAKGTIVVTETAKLAFQATFDANGELDLNITEAGAYTCYLVVVAGNDVWVSDAITFAA